MNPEGMTYGKGDAYGDAYHTHAGILREAAGNLEANPQ